VAIPGVGTPTPVSLTTTGAFSVTVPSGTRHVMVLAWGTASGGAGDTTLTLPAGWSAIYNGKPVSGEENYFGLLVAVSTTNSPGTSISKSGATNVVVNGHIWPLDAEIDETFWNLTAGQNNGAAWSGDVASPTTSPDAGARVFAFRALQQDARTPTTPTGFPTSLTGGTRYDGTNFATSNRMVVMSGHLSQASAGTTAVGNWTTDSFGTVWGRAVAVLAVQSPDGTTVTGTLSASAPALTVGPPTAAISGTVTAPTYSGAVAASTPAITAGPPTASISGTVTNPTWTGDVAASTPTITVGPPTAAITGTVTPPVYSGDVTASTPSLTVGPPMASISGTFTAAGAITGAVAANLPTVTVGPPTMDMSGTVTVPTYAGDLAASTAALTVGPPTTALSGTVTPPTFSGDLEASTPELTVGPPAAAITGTFVVPGSNAVAADLPTIVIGPPTVSVSGTVSVPVYAGAVAASTPTVTVGPPELAMSGSITAPVITGTMAASLPSITVGPLTAQIFDTSIPPLPITGVSLTVSTGTRELSVTTESRSLEVST
jgi:hypothetical protein